MKNTAKGTAQKVPRAKAQKKIMPLGDRVLVRQINEDEGKKSSGIFIPDSIKKEKPEEGEVIAVGNGKYVDGKLIPLSVKIGDTVLFSKYGYDEIKVDDIDYIILKEDSILAIIK